MPTCLPAFSLHSFSCLKLHQQLVKSQATLDDMSRTLHQQNQEITELRAKLQDRDTRLVDKTTLVTSLQDELSACISRFQMEKQQSAVELNDIRHAQIVERETINKKIDEVCCLTCLFVCCLLTTKEIMFEASYKKTSTMMKQQDANLKLCMQINKQ